MNNHEYDELVAEFRDLDDAIEIIKGWRQITTAPKDGTRILVWDNGCEIVSWRFARGSGGAWWHTIEGAYLDPKFWMPLPAGPTSR